MASSYLKAYWLAAYSKLFLALAVAAAVIYPVISETETTSSDHAAIIDIAGTIGGNADSENGMKIGKNILAAIRDEGAKAIILMANSPGGAPADSQIVYDLIDDYRKSAPLPPNLMTSINNAISDQNLKFMSDAESEKYRADMIKSADMKVSVSTTPNPEVKYRKPVIAVVKTICASACVQAVTRSDLIIVENSSIFGNIGVKMSVYNWHSLAERLGVSNQTIASGVDKNMLSPWESLDERQVEKARRTMIMPVFEHFKQNVQDSRPNLKGEIFDGTIWTGDDAISVGLVDLEATPLQVTEALKRRFGWDMKPYSQKAISLSSLFQQAASVVLSRTDSLLFE